MMAHSYPNGTSDNPKLRTLLDRESNLYASVRPCKGFVSLKSLFSHRETDGLQAFIRSCLPPGEWELQGWGVILEPGGQLERHDHTFPGNVWSGAYYLQAGGGEIRFDDGSYSPEESSLIVFPADKPHSVVATERRYSIAFNARTGGC